MKWKQYNQLTPEQKEEHNFRFKISDNYHVRFIIMTYSLLTMSIISATGAIISNKIILAKLSEAIINLSMIIWSLYILIIFVTKIKEYKWIKKLNLRK